METMRKSPTSPSLKCTMMRMKRTRAARLISIFEFHSSKFNFDSLCIFFETDCVCLFVCVCRMKMMMSRLTCMEGREPLV